MRSVRDAERRRRRGRRFLAALLAAPAILGCEKLPDIPNVPPVASFIYTPVSPINAGQTPVTFNASGSRDSDGHITSHIWNFGDGTPEETGGSPVATHVFPDTSARCLDITYTVLLTVVDDQGDRGSASQTVRVTELPVPGSNDCR